MAAGYADVRWPLAALVFLSEDGTVWRYAGDLVDLSARLLYSACSRVLAPLHGLDPASPLTALDWRTDRDRSTADAVRVEILEALTAVQDTD